MDIALVQGKVVLITMIYYFDTSDLRKPQGYVILIPQARVLCHIRTSPRAAGPRVRSYNYIRQSMSACGIRYKCYVPHYPCRLIAHQYEVEIRIYYIDRLGKFDYGPAHASRNHCYTYVCQLKWENPMESMESSYKRLNSCFMAIAPFHKVYYTSKGLAFFLKRVSRVIRCGP